jgi:hypothetical protein
MYRRVDGGELGHVLLDFAFHVTTIGHKRVATSRPSKMTGKRVMNMKAAELGKLDFVDGVQEVILGKH